MPNKLQIGIRLARQDGPPAPIDVTSMLQGDWGTPPGPDSIYAPLNPAIKEYGFDITYIASSGHGGPAA